MLHLLILLIVIGVLLWLVNAYIPMDAKVARYIIAKNIMNIVVVILVVLWLLSVFGLLSGLDTPIPRVH